MGHGHCHDAQFSALRVSPLPQPGPGFPVAPEQPSAPRWVLCRCQAVGCQAGLPTLHVSPRSERKPISP